MQKIEMAENEMKIVGIKIEKAMKKLEEIMFAMEKLEEEIEK